MSEPETETLSIPATVHGHVLVARGPQAGAGAPLLVGFHGYAETARVHLRQLSLIPGSGRFVRCAVQALHPFYLRGEEIGANWMTRFDRERAIADNVAYVAAAVKAIRAGAPGAAGLVYAGFSQGVAMAYRAAADAGHPCRGLVALGGDVPPELAGRDLAGFPPVLLGRGRAETWYTEERMTRDVELLRAKGVSVRPFHYDGGHEWTDAFRAAAGEFLTEVCP